MLALEGSFSAGQFKHSTLIKKIGDLDFDQRGLFDLLFFNVKTITVMDDAFRIAGKDAIWYIPDFVTVRRTA